METNELRSLAGYRVANGYTQNRANQLDRSRLKAAAFPQAQRAPGSSDPRWSA
ncbi:MAG: hypothetical protein R2911_43440 [Caldilineaceae bacterium]